MNVIKNIDFLGNEPQTFIFKKNLYQTYLGGCFSILTTLALLTFSLYFISIAFQRQQVNLLSSQTTKFEKKLNLSSIPFLFFPANMNGVLYNTSVVYPVIQYWDYSAELKCSVKVTTLPLKQCDMSDLEGYETLFKNFSDLGSHYCMNKKGINLTLLGDYGDITNGYSKLHVYVAKCRNDSIYNPNPGRQGCLPQDQIDKILTSLPLHFYTTFPDYEIDF
jgi:hypothetical protein